MNQLEKFNQKYPVQIELPVQWGDMDAFNHVNNVMYFKYFESVRIAYFEAIGVLDNNDKDYVAPILAETSCRYKMPLNYPDQISVGASIIERHTFGFLMEYAIYSQQLKKITSIGTGRVVMLNYSNHQKVMVSEELIVKINQVEGNSKFVSPNISHKNGI